MPPIGIAAISATIAILMIGISSRLRRKQVDSAEEERRRRDSIHETGRLAAGAVTEFHGDTVYFSYTIAGMEYMAAQDISAFRGELRPEGDHLLVGPCGVKYLVENPANSIVICEGWSGLSDRL